MMATAQSKGFSLTGLLTNVNPQSLIKPEKEGDSLLSIVMVQDLVKLSLNLTKPHIHLAEKMADWLQKGSANNLIKPNIQRRAMMTNDDILTAFAGAQILTNPKFFSSLEINTREGENEFSDSIKKVSHKVTLSLVDHLFSLAGYRYLSLITLKTRSGRKLAGLLAASPDFSTSSLFSSVMTQPSGSGLAVSCCASCRAISTSSRSCSPAWFPISPMRSKASRAPLRLDSSFPSALSLSWRREISLRAAKTTKAAMLSPFALNASIPSITSCGKRIFFSCDLVFTLPVAICPPAPFLVCKQYSIECVLKRLDENTHHKLKSIHTLSTDKAQAVHKITKPSSALTLTGPLTTNDRMSIEAAMLNHTPTRFKFLFLAVRRSDLNAKPHRESVTAHSEQDARRSLAGQFVLSFAGRIPNRRVMA